MRDDAAANTGRVDANKDLNQSNNLNYDDEILGVRMHYFYTALAYGPLSTT